jgi:hypothetical protein
MERRAGIAILNLLCVNEAEFEFGLGEQITIRPQVSTDQGKPDIEIAGDNKYILVEIKHESGLGRNQVTRYNSLLKQRTSSGTGFARLVLLTRYPVAFEEHGERPYKLVRWSDVFGWCDGLKLSHPVASYIVNQFTTFLKEKRMILERVTWEYENGVPALCNLIAMLNAAVDAIGLKGNPSAGQGFIGLKFRNDTRFLGINYDKPMSVVIQHKVRGRWSDMHVLDLADKHFLCLDRDAQQKLLAEFVASRRTDIGPTGTP